MSALVVVFLIPFLWSAVVYLVRRINRRDGASPDDAGEKLTLAIILAPAVFGAALLMVWQLVPIPLAIPQLPVLPALNPLSEPAVASFAPAVASHPFHLLAWLVRACFAVYASGLLWNFARLIVAIIKIRRITSSAKAATIAGKNVHLTEAAIPPIAWGRSTIVLPVALASNLGAQDIRLILAHEQAHLDRLDPYYFAVLSWVDTIFWFNPFARHQTRRCRTAAEIACDRTVTHATPSLREAYAQLLVGILHLHSAAAIPLYAPAASTSKQVGDYRERLHAILSTDTVRPRRLRLAALAAVILPVAFAQLAYSQSSNPFPPLSATAVYAAADGRVIDVREEGQTSTPQGMRPDTVVVIDHGDDINGRYGVGPANSDLKSGNTVSAGQLLAKNGVLVGLEIQLRLANNGKPACFQPPARRCALTAGAMSGKTGRYTVAWNNAAFVMANRTVYADVMILDEPTALITAQGHVRIVGQDNRALLQRSNVMP